MDLQQVFYMGSLHNFIAFVNGELTSTTNIRDVFDFFTRERAKFNLISERFFKSIWSNVILGNCRDSRDRVIRYSRENRYPSCRYIIDGRVVYTQPQILEVLNGLDRQSIIFIHNEHRRAYITTMFGGDELFDTVFSDRNLVYALNHDHTHLEEQFKLVINRVYGQSLSRSDWIQQQIKKQKVC